MINETEESTPTVQIMESTISEVFTNELYLGNWTGMNDFQTLEKYGISCVINFGDPVIRQSKKIEYIYYPIKDSSSERINSYFERFYELVEEKFSRRKKIFVCCKAGISRAPSMVISYIMKKSKMSFNKAFDFVKRKREIVSPNLGFIFQLKEYENKLKL